MYRPKRIRPSTSPSRQAQSDDTAAHRLAPRGCRLTKFASATEKPESQPLLQPIGRFSSAQVNKTRGHEILQFAGLRSQVFTVYVLDDIKQCLVGRGGGKRGILPRGPRCKPPQSMIEVKSKYLYAGGGGYN